ncbi:hypothetical protein AVEN_159665-1 [Araneus ventricosus]|uniref:Uncharacterized protein n=1 Tax=Araneus ventricosus TaxID=182803 RepID=A0A4Y2FHH6_ARAVE|nr:hypothetical protein AVEN_159665-1 [Araneus ventricosus]
MKRSISAHAQTSRIENIIAQPKQLFSHLRSWRQRVGDTRGTKILQYNVNLLDVRGPTQLFIVEILPKDVFRS